MTKKSHGRIAEEKAAASRSSPKMKRCPQCNRLEPDDMLGYCRADGTVLISDSGLFSGEVGTVKFGSASVSSEIETSVLPHRSTASAIDRTAGPTTLLPAQTPGTTPSLLSELGEKEEAIGGLSDAAAKGDYWLFSIKYDPAFDPLRGDPRFQKLLKRFDPSQ